LELNVGALTLDDLLALHKGEHTLTLPQRAREAIVASHAVVAKAAAGDAPVYGVNTGFGKLASKRISREDLASLQLNLIRSHSVGVGEPMSPSVVRLILALKAACLARGHSGVRPIVVDTLLAAYNAGLVPYIPSQGSVGASGDLAPLSHMTLALIGEGEVLDNGIRLPARAALAKAGIAPLALEAKEGLALINGTQVSTAYSRSARSAGSNRCREVLPCAARGQCNSQVARRKRRSRARSVLLALSAASDWCMPRSIATRRARFGA
jgi:histidine ammonia-lyase